MVFTFTEKGMIEVMDRFFIILISLILLIVLGGIFITNQNQKVKVSVVLGHSPSVTQSVPSTRTYPKIRLLLYPSKFEKGTETFKNLSSLFDSCLDEAIASSKEFESESIKTQELMDRVENFLSHGTEEREVKISVKGEGVSRRDALENAFLNAIEQVCGVFISSRQSTHKEYINNNGKSEFYVSFKTQTDKMISGRITKYNVISEKHADSGQYTININANVVTTQQERVNADARYILVPVVERITKTQIDIPFSNKRKDTLEIYVSLHLIDLYTKVAIPIKNVRTSIDYFSNENNWPTDMKAFYTNLIVKVSSMIVQNIEQDVGKLTWGTELAYKNGDFFIRRGEIDGIKAGMKLRVMRKLYPIVDPKTQKIINYKMEEVSEAIVKKVYENYSLIYTYKRINDPTNCIVELRY